VSVSEPVAVEQQVQSVTRITLRPIGSSLPLGFMALGGASVVVSGLQLGWLPGSASHDVGLTVLAFTVPAQILASIFGFLARDSVGGTAMGIIASAWLTVGLSELMARPGTTDRTLGLLLLFAAAAVLVPTVAAALGKVLAAVILAMASVRFALTGVYEFSSHPGWETVSGWLGVVLATAALYAALAFEIEDTQRRTVLPVWRRGAGKRAVIGDLRDDVDRVAREAGVREQL
jgi:succinate-acetate transporter protein